MRRGSTRVAGRRRQSAGLSCILFVSVTGLAACRPDESPPLAGELLRDGVDYAMFQMRTFVTREGIRRARLEADTAEIIGETEIHMRPLKLTFFDADGREATEVTADSGVFYELTEDMEAYGSVVVLDRQDDRRLETELVRYVNAEDRLYGDVPFTLWSDGGRTEVSGDAFESDPGLDSVTVHAPSGSSRQLPPPPTSTDTASGELEASVAEVPDSAATRPDSLTSVPDSVAR